MSSIKLSELEVYVAVVEAGAITRAAENLGILKSSASRKLRYLEEACDVRLLERTTRRIAMTEAGEKVYKKAQVNWAMLKH
jgi:DNA-binding transcriptional LysR family regulator